MRITQINFDGIDLISSSSKFYVDNLLDIEKDITINETYSGFSYNSSKIKSKKITLNGHLFDTSFSYLSMLNGLFSTNKLHKIIFNVDFLGKIYCYAEIENVVKPRDSRKISIKLNMVDPYLYYVYSEQLILGATSGNSGLVYPIIYPFSFGSITGGQGVINNSGNVISYPVITIIGTCSDLIIKNNTTNESMNININLGALDTLTIDNRPATRSITLNGYKRMDLKNGSWISCVVGNNTFTFSRNSSESKQHCTVSLQNRFV